MTSTERRVEREHTGVGQVTKGQRASRLASVLALCAASLSLSACVAEVDGAQLPLTPAGVVDGEACYFPEEEGDLCDPSAATAIEPGFVEPGIEPRYNLDNCRCRCRDGEVDCSIGGKGANKAPEGSALP